MQAGGNMKRLVNNVWSNFSFSVCTLHTRWNKRRNRNWKSKHLTVSTQIYVKVAVVIRCYKLQQMMRNSLMWIGECCINKNPCRSAWDIWYTKRDGCACASSKVISMAVHGAPVSILLLQHYQVITVECMQEPHDSGVKFYYTSDDCDYYTQANNSKACHAGNNGKEIDTPTMCTHNILSSPSTPQTSYCTWWRYRNQSVQPRCIEMGVSNSVLLA